MAICRNPPCCGQDFSQVGCIKATATNYYSGLGWLNKYAYLRNHDSLYPSYQFDLFGSMFPSFAPVGYGIGVLTADYITGWTFLDSANGGVAWHHYWNTLWTFSLVAGDGDTDNAKFAIVPYPDSPPGQTSGMHEAMLATNYNFSGASLSTYSIRVRATSNTGVVWEKQFTLQCGGGPTAMHGYDIIRQRPLPESQNGSYSNVITYHSMPAHTAIASFTVDDEDPNDVYELLFLEGNPVFDHTPFEVVGNELRTKDEITENGFGFQWMVAVVAKNQRNETITYILGVELWMSYLYYWFVKDHQAAGEVVGQIRTFATEPVLSYSLVAGDGGDDNAKFAISGDTIITAVELDCHVQSEFSVRVRTTTTNVSFDEKISIKAFH
jgi:hypothetical protein